MDGMARRYLRPAIAIVIAASGAGTYVGAEAREAVSAAYVVDGAAQPAYVAAWDTQTRQAQREAGRKMVARIRQAAADGRTTVKIARGHYRFSDISEGRQPTHIELRDIDNLSVDFSGSTLWFEHQASAFLIAHCTNLKLADFQVDWQPLPFTQGTVVGIDPDKNTFDVRLAADFTDVTPEFAAVKPGERVTIRGGLFDPVTGHLKTGTEGWRVSPFWQNRIDERTYRVKVHGFHGVGVLEIGFEQDDRVALWRRKGRAFRIQNCGPVTLEDLTVYASPFVAFVEAAGKGPTTYRRVRIMRRPGTGRLIACNADGFNSSRMEQGPRLESCVINYAMDDALNVHGAYYKVLWQVNPTEIVVDRMAWRDQLKDNVTLDFFQIDEMAYVGRRAGTQLSVEQWELRRDRCLFSEATGWRAGGGGTLPFGKKMRVHRVKLDRPMEIPPGTIVSCEDYVGNGTVVRNTTVDSGFASGLKIMSTHARLENNRIARQQLAGIFLTSLPGFWGEATYPHNVVITGNELVENFIVGDNPRLRIRRAGIAVVTPGDYSRTKLQHDITISDNTIRKTHGAAIVVRGVRNLRLTGNRIVPPADKEDYQAATPGDSTHAAGEIVLESVRDARVHDNIEVRTRKTGP